MAKSGEEDEFKIRRGKKKDGMWKGREITEQSDSANLRECWSKESQVSPEAFGGLLVLNTHAS